MIEHAPVYWYDEIDSTSEEAKRRARAGETSPVWIAARQQTAGRGRLGRSWASPTGNLFVTVLFPESEGLTMASRIPFAAALAVRDACSAVVPDLDAKLKWPNDVRIDGAKICGILTETGESSGVVWIALGMGINVQLAPDVSEQAATSLVQQGGAPGLAPEHVLDDLRTCLARRVEQARNDFEGLILDWLRYAEGLGQSIEAGPRDRRVQGVFEGLAPDGGLTLRLPDGTRQTIRAGDVELVRQVD